MESNSVSEESGFSDSDDELEDIEKFIKTPSKCFNDSFLSTHAESDSTEICHRQDDQLISKTLDDLIAEVRLEDAKEDSLKKLKEELWTNLRCQSDNDSQETEGKHDLASEHAEHIDQLEVKASKLISVHPGLIVFHPDLFCCLFTETVSPCDFGFIPSNSMIDKYLSEINADNLEATLLSNVLLPCMSKISHLDKVMLWLWNMMSVQSSKSLVLIISKLLRNMIQWRSNEKVSNKNNKNCWCPDSLDLLQLLTNLGASQQDLLGKQTFYKMEDVSYSLCATQDTAMKREKTLSDKMFVGSFKNVLNILSLCLQTSPLQNRNNISFMFYLLAVTSLDKCFQNCLSWEFEVCFSSLLECYTSSDWLESMPELCRCLADITEHHHNQAHLIDKMPRSARGRGLRQRLGLIFLHCQLAPANLAPPSLDCDVLKLTDILRIGSPTSEGEKGTPLCKSLQMLVMTDLYKLSSIIIILDLTVGDELQRAEQSVPELQFLISEIQTVIKTIRDNMNDLDFSKIKDALTFLTMKWSMTLQDTKSKQKTIFNWMTARPHKPVHPEVLKDKQCLELDDADD